MENFNTSHIYNNVQKINSMFTCTWMIKLIVKTQMKKNLN